MLVLLRLYLLAYIYSNQVQQHCMQNVYIYNSDLHLHKSVCIQCIKISRLSVFTITKSLVWYSDCTEILF